MRLLEQPDPRIGTDQLALVSLPGTEARLPGAKESPIEVWAHRRAGCPKVSSIEVFDGYLRCSKCYNPLTTEAANHVGQTAGSYDERTNSFRI